MPNKVVQPCEKQVGFLPELAGERLGIRLERFEIRSDSGGFRGGQHPNRCQVSGVAVSLNRVFSQGFHEASLPTVIQAPPRADGARKPRGFDVKATIAAQPLHLAMFHVAMVPVPSLRVPPPMMCDHRSHRRRRRHDRRRRRRRLRRRWRGAGSQRESRNKSGRAERPASRDKTHVSPPRVESDTLYQLDTQSRAAQDNRIIASSRLFSMGNLTTNHRNDDHPDLWRRRSPRRKARCRPSAARGGRAGLCSGPQGGPIHPNRRHRTPRALRSLRDGRPAYEIRCAQRQNPVGGNRIRHLVLGSRDRSTVARKSLIRSRDGGNQPVPSTQMFNIAMPVRHSSPALPLPASALLRVLGQAVVLAASGSARSAI